MEERKEETPANISLIFETSSFVSNSANGNRSIAFNPNTNPFLEWLRSLGIGVALVRAKGPLPSNHGDLGFSDKEVFEIGPNLIEELRLLLGNTCKTIVAGRQADFMMDAIVGLRADPIIFGTTSVNIDMQDSIRYHRALELLTTEKENVLELYRRFESPTNQKQIEVIFGIDDLAKTIAARLTQITGEIVPPFHCGIATPEVPLAY